MSKLVKHLYKELKPAHYELKLTPDLQTLTYKGTVTIDLKKTGRPSQRLTFHEHGVKITSAKIIKHDKKGDIELTLARINSQHSLDEVRLHTQEQVYSGDYTVTMEFGGEISRTMHGLYRCYFQLDGAEHVMAATQFESHYARNCFPCIDEPEAKATFDLTLVSPKSMAVIANTPVKTERMLDNDLKQTSFETTPKMSTYLLAFVIGELQSVTTMTKRGTTVSAWATIAQPKAALEFPLDIAKRSIEYFEDYFDTPYPLAKCDHVALPDFSVGAMENWGLITYRERRFLAYPGQTSQASKESIVTVITHETSHQWFGNLVTMKWWDNLWLNESFANLMEYQAADAMFPEWHIWNDFASYEGLAALRRDASTGVQAVQTGVRHPDEISTLFDGAIVYAKGGRLLYMMKTYIGEEAFRKGLTSYFKKHAYGNTTGNDLWQALSEASGIDVAAFMNPWLERAGFPVVTVDAGADALKLTQQHFLESGVIDDELVWPVPLFSSDPALPKLLDTPTKSVKTAKPLETYIDQGAAGHYIVRYSNPDHQTAVTAMVHDQKLGTPDRLMLLNSASMLARAGVQSFADTLQLLSAYANESSEPVWSIMALILAESRRFIDLDERIEPGVKAFIRRLIASEYKRLGWKQAPDESANDTKLRATVIALGCYADEPAIVAEAIKQYTESTDLAALPAELRGIIMSVAVREQVDEAVDTLLKLHDGSVNSDLRSDIMDGLTATHDAALAGKLLGRLADAKLTKPQDAYFWLFYLLRNRYTREVAWQWMVDRWDSWIKATYHEDNAYDDFPRIAAGICNTKVWADKYKALFEPKIDELQLQRNITIGLNEIAARVAWLERDLVGVQKFFSK